MSRFLLEVPHEAEHIACVRAIKILFDTGSHFLINADFGCYDGVHRAWLIVDVDSKEEARNIIPPAYREATTVTALNKFSPEEINKLLQAHKDKH